MTTTIDFARLTLQDALDLAILIEEEARDRYLELAQFVGGRYPGDAGDVFRTMAGNEEKHGAQLAGRRRELFGRRRPRVDRSMLFDVEAPDLGAVRVFMSARQAVEVALASEQKAHDFFDEALEHVKDRQVKKLFEELKTEEKAHQAALRKLMRKLPRGPDVEESEADEPPPM